MAVLSKKKSILSVQSHSQRYRKQASNRNINRMKNINIEVSVCLFVCLMVFNATFNNISVRSWRSVLLEETGGPGENHRPVARHCKFYHIMLYTSPLSRFDLTLSVVISTDCIRSCKSNYHTIMATTATYTVRKVLKSIEQL